jgi:hypothetical protein
MDNLTGMALIALKAMVKAVNHQVIHSDIPKEINCTLHPHIIHMVKIQAITLKIKEAEVLIPIHIKISITTK